MSNNHRYKKEDWSNYYHNQLDENLRLEMTLHLSGCDECLDYYEACVMSSIYKAPVEIKDNVMKALKNPINTKQVMLTYILAASIALGFYSFGIMDKTIDYVPQRIEQSTKVAQTATNHFSQIINNFVWRD